LIHYVPDLAGSAERVTAEGGWLLPVTRTMSGRLPRFVSRRREKGQRAGVGRGRYAGYHALMGAGPIDGRDRAVDVLVAGAPHGRSWAVSGAAVRSAVLGGLAGAVRWLSTPLFPEDYLALVNPLWCRRELRGRIEAIHAETADVATLVIRPGRGWIPHKPGQWVRIGVDIEGVRHWRT
jgi:hypothetical protein